MTSEWGMTLFYDLITKTIYINPGQAVRLPIREDRVMAILYYSQLRSSLKETPHFVQASKHPSDCNSPHFLQWTTSCVCKGSVIKTLCAAIVSQMLLATCRALRTAFITYIIWSTATFPVDKITLLKSEQAFLISFHQEF